MTRHAILGSGTIAVILLTIFLGCSSCGSGGEKPATADVDSSAVESAEFDAVQPDEEHRVDIGRWSDMSRKDFDNQYTTFAQSEPPVVRDYGICDSITCHFPSAAPEALPEILVCNLRDVYLVTDAFRLLGIEIGAVGSTTEPWISVTSLDKRFSALQYKAAGKYADRTTQILLQFNRGEE
jgi:hypothetical protein